MQKCWLCKSTIFYIVNLREVKDLFYVAGFYACIDPIQVRVLLILRIIRK